MSNFSFIDVFLRLIPEGLIIILAGYALAKKSIDTKRYLLSSLIVALSIFIFKLLPISAALPMILSIFIAIIALIFINKIKTAHAIISSVVCFIVMMLTEAINLLVLQTVFHVNTDEVFLNAVPLEKYLYGLPSMLVFAAIVLAYYFISKRKRAQTDVTDK